MTTILVTAGLTVAAFTTAQSFFVLSEKIEGEDAVILG
jgi:hypothetical protein